MQFFLQWAPSAFVQSAHQDNSVLIGFRYFAVAILSLALTTLFSLLRAGRSGSPALQTCAFVFAVYHVLVIVHTVLAVILEWPVLGTPAPHNDDGERNQAAFLACVAHTVMLLALIPALKYRTRTTHKTD